MSKISTATVDTISTTTDLTLTTANATAGKILLQATGGPVLYGNGTAITYSTNSSGNYFPYPATFSNTSSFTGNATFGLATITNCVPTFLNTGNTVVTGTVNVSTNTFNLGTSTIGTANASSGYTYLPNGLKLNWGTVSANSTTGTATFSSAFSTNCFCVTASAVGPANVATVTSINTTAAGIRTNLAGAVGTVFYMAIGV